jgi:hypothetical protein
MLDLVALILLVVVVRIAFKRFIKHVKGPPDPTERCPCGYVLENLSVPRCPECGRVLGLNATAEELGLSNEELLRAQEVKRKRQNERSAG